MVWIALWKTVTDGHVTERSYFELPERILQQALDSGGPSDRSQLLRLGVFSLNERVYTGQ